MPRTPEEIKADIQSQEAILALLQQELKQAENQPKPKPGDVYVDQYGVAYIATARRRADYGDPALWQIGGSKWNKNGAFHGTFTHWTEEKGRVLTKVTEGGDPQIFFNALTARAGAF